MRIDRQIDHDAHFVKFYRKTHKNGLCTHEKIVMFIRHPVRQLSGT